MRPLSNDGGLFPNSGALRRGRVDTLAEQDLSSLSPVVLLGFSGPPSAPSFPSWTWDRSFLRSCASLTCVAQPKQSFRDNCVPKCNLGTRSTEEDENGNGEVVKRKLPSQDDVFLRPGMHLVAVRARQFVRLYFFIRPKFFFHHLAGGSQFSGGRAPDENSFCHGRRSFR